jgi:hypothetical protein
MVEDGLPVATILALRPNCLTKAVTMPCVEEPLVDYAMVWLSAMSVNLRMGESARTYQ